jgi:hypothetical protein
MRFLACRSLIRLPPSVELGQLCFRKGQGVSSCGDVWTYASDEIDLITLPIVLA